MRFIVIPLVLVLAGYGEYRSAHDSGESSAGQIGTVIVGSVALAIIIGVILLGLDRIKREKADQQPRR